MALFNNPIPTPGDPLAGKGVKKKVTVPSFRDMGSAIWGGIKRLGSIQVPSPPPQQPTGTTMAGKLFEGVQPPSFSAIPMPSPPLGPTTAASMPSPPMGPSTAVPMSSAPISGPMTPLPPGFQAPTTPMVSQPTSPGGRTPSGAIVDGQGNIIKPPPSSPAADIPPPAPDQPVTDETGATRPMTPSDAEKAQTDAEKAYQIALQISPEELSTQEDLDKLIEATKKGYLDTEGKPIALGAISGQTGLIERRALAMAEPLERKLARLQAKRTSALEASKFALERADKDVKAEEPKAAFSVAPGASIFDPNTGEFIGTAPPKPSDPKAPTTMETSAGIVQWNPETQEWDSTGFRKPTAEAAITRAEKAKEKAETVAAARRRTINNATNAIAAIDKALASGAINDTAVSRVAQSKIPGLEGYNLSRYVETIKALVGFGALEEMRKASPTGGALGQVSERELSFLQATIASLDIGQDSAVLIENLEQVKDSFEMMKLIASPDGTIFELDGVPYMKQGDSLIPQ